MVGAALIMTFVKVTAALNWYPEPLGSASAGEAARFAGELDGSEGVGRRGRVAVDDIRLERAGQRRGPRYVDEAETSRGGRAAQLNVEGAR